MDEEIFKRVTHSLLWEARYRTANEELTKEFFLESQACLDPDFENAINEYAITSCKALDIGTGNGEQAVFLSRKKFNVTATDASESAINTAKKFAATHKVHVNFMVDNILLTKLTGQFDLIIDRGCYTLIDPEYKPAYIAAVKKLLSSKGWLLIKMDKRKNQVKFFEDDGDFEIMKIPGIPYKKLNGDEILTIFLAVQKRQS